MFDDREFLARVEAADPGEFAQLLARPTADEERALRTYLGDARYDRMHSMALRKRSRSKVGAERNVVVLHGIMGGELTAYRGGIEPHHLWFKKSSVLLGRLERLKLAPDGRSEADADWDVRPTGILKKYYGQILLYLSREWNVRGFWFDWRKDLRASAARLAAEIQGWFGADQEIHLVAHSMGGLVARTFVHLYPENWKAMRGRLIMLGTPNRGSYTIPQVITGLEPIVRRLAKLDVPHDRREVLDIVNTFPGSLQMLPWPEDETERGWLYDARTYGDSGLEKAQLEDARRLHQTLAGVADGERMVYVAGCNQPTPCGIADVERLAEEEGYRYTLDGDGRVPHTLGTLPDVPNFYVDEAHGDLPSNELVLRALDKLLESGETDVLEDKPIATRTPLESRQKQLRARRDRDEEFLDNYTRRVRTRGEAEVAAEARVWRDDLRVEEIVLGDLLGRTTGKQEEAGGEGSAGPLPKIEVGLVFGGLEEMGEEREPAGGKLPVDAIAVGHYIGVKPMGAELYVDRAITEALIGKKRVEEDDLLLTQFTERGTIRGELGQPFVLPDPRLRRGGRKTKPDRVVMISGMGLPGRFGMPELSVLVRELLWSLGRMGKRHLASIVIGSGYGNIPLEDALSAWLNGIQQALAGTPEGSTARVERVTFVDHDPNRVEEIETVLKECVRRVQDELNVDYRSLSEEDLERLPGAKRSWARRRRRKRKQTEGGEGAPTRMTIELDRSTYRFGAITATASIPEREIPLDPELVDQANLELVAAGTLRRQVEHGRFLERLLIPRDLRDRLSTRAPLVLMLDTKTARYHWEMVAQPEFGASPEIDGDAEPRVSIRSFLGTSRGLTRQLRTTFAPPPEPPPPPRRALRVLVVADPAEDARLAGAEFEGVEVADLFEDFNKIHGATDNQVEVTRLFGPQSATRTNVLRHLMLKPYDVLHFAGHCEYVEDSPADSGWLFSGGKRLSAYELNRLDRIPRFVFSNACESGKTSDRPEDRISEVAPSFAEAFFARGVSNFVCTAWPVDDFAARLFARHLYAGLLGLRVQEDEATGAAEIKVMHRAMRDARLAVAAHLSGRQTWGAYQHYGNPYYRFFQQSALDRSRGS